jgi:hypothetical protein
MMYSLWLYHLVSRDALGRIADSPNSDLRVLHVDLLDEEPSVLRTHIEANSKSPK